MGQPTLFEEWVIYPIKRAISDFRIKMMVAELKTFGMDFGKYPVEEIYKLYHKHGDEIERI